MYIGRDEKKKKDTLTLSLGQIEQLDKKKTRTRIKKITFFFLKILHSQSYVCERVREREGEGEGEKKKKKKKGGGKRTSIKHR